MASTAQRHVGVEPADGFDQRIVLLGEFAVRRNGEVLALSSDAQRLVAFLALRRRRLPRTLVAGALWLEQSQERAYGNLRSTLWRLRRDAASIIQADAHSLSIAPGVDVDVDRATRQARALSGGGRNYTLELFLEDLLPGWYDEWVLIERERLRQQSLHALEAIASALCDRKEHGAAVQAALHAIRIDPFRESAHRCLIRIHLDEGNASEALRQFEAYRTTLAEELGLAPSPRMIELVRNAALVSR